MKIVDQIDNGTFKVEGQRVEDVQGVNEKLILQGIIKENNQSLEISATHKAGLWVPKTEFVTTGSQLGKLCKYCRIDDFDRKKKQFVGKEIPASRDSNNFWRLNI